MATSKISIIDTKGIKNATSQFKPEEAICEYIWNGFDAGATKVELRYEFIESRGVIKKLEIVDNGSGIDFDKLGIKFQPVLESRKLGKKKNINPLIKGENGYGRYTFYKFGTRAR
jgi:hypothetical protein